MKVKTGHSNSNKPTAKMLSLLLHNVRSVRNKAVDIMDYVLDSKCDICALTETWLTDRDCAVLDALTPPNFNFVHIPRKGGTGGGVGLLYKDNLIVKQLPQITALSFEHLECSVTAGTKTFRLIIIYRTCPSKKNGLTSAMFLSEFSDYLENSVVSSGPVL